MRPTCGGQSESRGIIGKPVGKLQTPKEAARGEDPAPLDGVSFPVP